MAGKKYKLLLINPVNKRRKGLMRSKESIYPPLALGIIAALTPGNWDVEIHDENFEPFEYKEADFIGFTSLTATINRCYEIASMYRENGVKTVIGGIHASMLPEEAIQYVDAVVVGEAEYAWKQVIYDFEHRQLKKIYKADLPSMVDSPSPRIELYHPGYAFGSMQTTRGCPMRCEFCSVHTFNGSKYRLRPVDQSVADFTKISHDRIYIVDDNFVGYSQKARDHAVAFFKGVAASGVKKQWAGSASMNIAQDEEVLEWAARSGCKLVFLGVESELVDQLQQARKDVNLKIGVDHYQQVYEKIHSYGISVVGAFILGLDNDTPETILNRTEYMIESDIDIMQAAVLTPLPGTELFKRLETEGRLLYHNYPEDWERYNYAEVVFQPLKMSVKEYKNAVHESWSRLYDIKTLKRKFLQTLKLTKDPIAAAWAFNSNLHLYNFCFENERPFMAVHDAFPQLADYEVI
ncbi:MAG: B12-binding domain-containing radical SAM protein [Bacteroidales bacterium]|nr:B12-binding domain-containing radical SAM protein [Bacteroidales bacterium]